MNNKFLSVRPATLSLLATTVGAAIIDLVVGRSGCFRWTNPWSHLPHKFSTEAEWTRTASDTGTIRIGADDLPRAGDAFRLVYDVLPL